MSNIFHESIEQIFQKEVIKPFNEELAQNVKAAKKVADKKESVSKFKKNVAAKKKNEFFCRGKKKIVLEEEDDEMVASNDALAEDEENEVEDEGQQLFPKGKWSDGNVTITIDESFLTVVDSEGETQCSVDLSAMEDVSEDEEEEYGKDEEEEEDDEAAF